MPKIRVKISYNNDADQAQEAREVAAKRLKQAAAPGERQTMEIPEHLQNWHNYIANQGRMAKEQVLDLWHHPENMIGPGPLGGPVLGIFAGPLAKRASQTMLQKAWHLESKGLPDREIFDKTGWFRGADNKWRFEIPDAEAKYLKDPDFGVNSMSTMKDVIDHPELYEQYPELADIWAKTSRKESGNLGSYSPDKYPRGEITLRKDLDDPRSTALHELQHAVQEKEGFDPGTNVSAAGTFEKYKNTMGEVEARNVEQRAKVPKKNLIFPRDTEDVPLSKQIPSPLDKE